MAYELVAEVLDHAPADLTPAQRLVMVVIAEFVHRADYERGLRETSRSAADIARRAGLKPEGLKTALQGLAKHKHSLEVRVPLSEGKDGRPVYATPGRVGTFRVPELPAPADCFCESCKKDIPTLGVIHKGGSQPPLVGHKGGSQPPLGGLTAPPGGATAPPLRARQGRSDQRVSKEIAGQPRGAQEPPLPGPVPGKPGPRAWLVPADTDIETVIDELSDLTGKLITEEHAERVWRDVLGRANPRPRHLLSYVLKAISAEPHRYAPVPMPPPYKSGRQSPLIAIAD